MGIKKSTSRSVTKKTSKDDLPPAPLDGSAPVSKEWVEFKGFPLKRTTKYLVGCSRTKKQAYVNLAGGELITSRGVYLDWKPDKILVIPEL